MTEPVPSGSSDSDASLPVNCEKGPSIIMVEEATNENMPPAMKDLLTVAQSGAEVMVGLLQILMAECGFCLASDFQEEHHIARNEPYFDVRILKKLRLDISKNSSGIFSHSFLLRGYSEPSIEILCAPQNNNVLVSAVLSSFRLVFSVVLKTQNYIVQTSQSSFMIFNMRSLSIKFKNSIALPVRAAILNKLGVPNPSLEGLPEEVLNLIWKKVPRPEFLSPAISQASEIFTSNQNTS